MSPRFIRISALPSDWLSPHAVQRKNPPPWVPTLGAGDYPIPLTPSDGHNVNSVRYVLSAARYKSGWAVFVFQQKVPTEGGLSVFTGKRFRLSESTLGILSENGERIAVQILKDAIVEVTSGPRPDDQGMVDVVWEGKTLTMFAQDIRDRGEEVKGKRATKAF